LIVINNIF